MLAAPGSEPWLEPEEVFFVGLVQRDHRCSLDDLVFQRGHRQWALPPVPPLGCTCGVRAGPDSSPMDRPYRSVSIFGQGLLGRPAMSARPRRVTRSLDARAESRRTWILTGGKALNFSFFRCLVASVHAPAPVTRAPRPSPVRALLAHVSLFPRPGAAGSAAVAPALFVGFPATLAGSDFLRPCIIGYGSSPFRCGPAAVAERSAQDLPVPEQRA